jgi:heme/copper-type cytochrome/quinol oxidase subunit 2
MKDQTWFNAVAILSVGAVLVLGAGLFLVGGSTPTPAGARVTGTPSIDRSLSITFNATTQQYDYSTTSVVVPANTLVTFTITNFDTGTAPLAVPWDNHVIGAVGGNEQVASGGSRTTVSALSPHDISHTFTMFGAFYNLSIPIPPAVANGEPTVVTFTVEFTTPGVYSWGCMAYCGTMSPLEKMSGTVDITG